MKTEKPILSEEEKERFFSMLLSRFKDHAHREPVGVSFDSEFKRALDWAYREGQRSNK